jgi:hypothetical protein
MTPTDIAIGRGYYRIAHFLTAARNLHRDQETAPSTPSTPTKSVPVRLPDSGGKAPAQSAANESAKVDSPTVADDADAMSPWPAGEPYPFDPAVPAPGSQLRSMQAH